MDELRARAYIDLLLGTDSRPGQEGPGQGGSSVGRPADPGMPPGTGALPAGFAGRVNLTIPLATLLGLAERPGEIAGIGPIDPDAGANTLDRYQTGASADPGIQHINVPDRYPRRSETGVRHVHRHAAATG